MESNQDNGLEHGVHSIIPSPVLSPRLTRFKNAINPGLKAAQRPDGAPRDNPEEPTARLTARGPYVIHAPPERDNHVPSYMSQQSASDHDTSHFDREPRNLHFANRQASRAGESSSHVVAAHVHATPRTRQIRDIAKPRRLAPQRRGSLPHREPGLGNLRRPLRRAESFSDRVKGFESLNGQPPSRSAYDFLEEYKSHYHKPKPNLRRHSANDADVELGLAEGAGDSREEQSSEDKPWLPTGIYLVFFFTLWTAVVKIVDSVEKNGPAVCAPGEEARLWACAGSLALLHGIFEALWQRKSLFKALFSMVWLLSYMLVSHLQPLVCLLGADALYALSKWQAAVNCFVGALLGVLVYKNIQLSVRSHKTRKETSRRRRRNTNQPSDDEFSFDGVPTWPSSKSPFSQPFKEKCISEVARIGSIIIFHLRKLWKAKFSILCDVIFLVRLQEKLEIDHSWEFKGQEGRNQRHSRKFRNQWMRLSERDRLKWTACRRCMTHPLKWRHFSWPARCHGHVTRGKLPPVEASSVSFVHNLWKRFSQIDLISRICWWLWPWDRCGSLSANKKAFVCKVTLSCLSVDIVLSIVYPVIGEKNRVWVRCDGCWGSLF